MIEAVIFDMDGLLIDTEPHWQMTERIVFKELGIIITPEMQKETFGLRTDEQIAHWYHYKPWKNASVEMIEKRYHAEMLGFFKKNARLMEGAMHALDFFSNKQIPLALASSSTMELIDAFLDRFSLRERFRVVYSAETETYGKPHPGVYIETSHKLGVEAIKCLALEDSFHGLIAAKAAKMKTIAVPEKYDPRFEASDIVLKSLTELTEEVFQKLNGSKK